jgi:dTDP-4-amino-4,6-dideoxygalactose transaminase
MTRQRLYLSPPHLSGREQGYVQQVFDSNWIAPLGPHVDGFEREMCARLRGAGPEQHAAALSAGTAGLHLALQLVGVRPGDVVVTSTLTFAATANAVTYVGAQPAFVDAEPATWTMDPELLDEALTTLRRAGRRVGAVLPVDLYGQVCDFDRIGAICARHGVPVVEDAAEGLGSVRNGRAAGTFGAIAVLSFNGNKIITTSGGGMLLSADKAYVDQARFLATQARDPAPHYQHSHIGYNYRMSNLLAAVGRGQLEHLDDRIDRRRAVRERYVATLGALPGWQFLQDPPGTRTNAWLSCATIDAAAFGADREAVRVALGAADIEARPVWKPMHLQPVFRDCEVVGGAVAKNLFRTGLCLPSGTAMSKEDLERVAAMIRATEKKRRD